MLKKYKFIILILFLLFVSLPIIGLDQNQIVSDLSKQVAKELASQNSNQTKEEKTRDILPSSTQNTQTPQTSRTQQNINQNQTPTYDFSANLSFIENLFYQRFKIEDAIPVNYSNSLYLGPETQNNQTFQNSQYNQQANQYNQTNQYYNQQYTQTNQSNQYNNQQNNNQTNQQNKQTQINSNLLQQKPKEVIMPLYQFGYDTFNKPFTNNAMGNNNLPVNNDYILGPGDSLVVYLWGKIEKKFNLTLDRNGNVFISDIGYLNLGHLRFSDAQKMLKNALSAKYIDFNIDVVLDNMKSIKIFVLGEVNLPGVYNFDSFTSAIATLYEAKGPTKLGSLRNVKVIRNKKVIYNLDLYRHLLKGEGTQDVTLKNNDIVYVPAIGSVVAIRGMVKRPAIYELNGKTSLYDLISFTGGLLPTSYYKTIQVERIKDGKTKVIFDLKFSSLQNFTKNLKSVYVQDGDVITVLPISEQIKNFISIEGNIERPGSFQYNKGLTLAKVIKMADGFLPDTYLKRIEIYRFISKDNRKMISVDYNTPAGKNFLLADQDIIKIYSVYDVLGEQYVYIDGAVKKPGAYKLIKNMKAYDLVFQAQLDNYAKLDNIEIYRQAPGQLPKIIPINITKIIQNPSSTQNIVLIDNDRLFIKYEYGERVIKKATITGDVYYPGTYVFVDGDKLSDLIKRAGGYTPRSFLFGAVFKRESVKQQEQAAEVRILGEEQKRLIYDQSLANIQNQSSMQNAVNFLTKEVQENSGRIVINLQPLSEFTDSSNDILLENGDQLYIPQIPAAVQIVGGVKNPNAVAYQLNKDSYYYINLCGGLSEFADAGGIIILKANGNVTGNSGNIQVGDVIYIPEKIKKEIDWMDVLNKSASILGNIILVFAGLKTLNIIH